MRRITIIGQYMLTMGSAGSWLGKRARVKTKPSWKNLLKPRGKVQPMSIRKGSLRLEAENDVLVWNRHLVDMIDYHSKGCRSFALM